MYFYQKGSGNAQKPALVFVHGFCENHSIWDALIEKLSDQFTCFALDIPGFGASTLPANKPIRLDTVAAELWGWAQKEGLQNAVWIGHSMGGYLILSMLHQFPNAMRAFGLIHSSALADSEEKKEGRNKVIEFVKERGVKVFTDAFIQDLFYTGNRDRLQKEIDQVKQTAARTAKESLITYTEAMRDRKDHLALFKSTSLPKLFIAGDHDPAVPLDKVEQHRPFVDRDHFHFLENTGHMGMYERPNEVYQALQSFLQRLLAN